ncbi:MAG TPA: acyl-CoA dehydrogenase [Pseudonocardia sp.]|nr:acyl-CoA dehydrogenase [Pseudonocardia sp.]
MTATDPFLTEEQRALRDSVASAMRRDGAPGGAGSAGSFDEGLWKDLCSIGVPELGVPLDDGSENRTPPMLDSLVVAQLCGRELAAVPVVESIVAARLLHRCTERTPWWDRIVSGELIATLAPRPAVGGVAGLVPSGAIAPVVIALDGEELVAVRSEPPPAQATTAGLPLADRVIGDGVAGERVVLARGVDAVERHRSAVVEWKALAAGLLAGIASASLAIAVDYVQQRHQFGAPIAVNQAVRHRLADLAARVDGALLIAREACRAHTDVPDRAELVSEMAFAFCGATARDAAAEGLHLHGGYGFTLEYEIQRYLRWAKSWSLLAGPAHHGYADIARAGLVEPAGLLAADPQLEEFRAEVRGFLAEHCTSAVTDRVDRTGTVHDWAMHRALVERGWVFRRARHTDAERASQPWSALRDVVLREEAGRVGAPLDGVHTTDYVIETVRAVGSDPLREQVLGPISRGEAIGALGFSEPEAGSDVAAARTTARREGDEWVINGQKMFTTLAHEARWIFLLTRTNPDVPKHKGLTMFLVPVPSPGLELQPVHTLGGERTNVTFYTDVRVPDSARVGPVDGGWGVLAIALGHEHSLSFSGECLGLVEHALDAVRALGLSGDELVLDRIGRAMVDTEVARLLAYRCGWHTDRGEQPGPEGSMTKLFSTEALVRHAAELTDLLGPSVLLRRGEPDAPAGGHLEHAYRHSQVTTIFGGTSEIHRNIIAEHHLGLRGSRDRKAAR